MPSPRAVFRSISGGSSTACHSTLSSVVSEARASTTPSTFDYGWRTPESPTAVRDGTVYEFN